MTLSKRLALLGVRSAMSVSKSRAFGSPYGLIDRRSPFPYRQISDLTKDSSPPNNSHMETLEDDSSPELMRITENGNILRNLVEKDRAEVEKMRTEQAKAGFIYRRPLRLSDFPIEKYPSENSQGRYLQFTARLPETRKLLAKLKRCDAEDEKNKRLLAELDELAKMRLELKGTESRIAFRKTMDDSANWRAKYSREFKADLKATRRQINIWGTTTALLTPVLIIFFGLFGIDN